MNKFVVDSSAWIEYLSGRERGKRVRALVEKSQVFATGFIAAEVCLKFLKDGQNSDQALMVLSSATLIPFDFAAGKSAAEIYFQQRKMDGKFGLADAHVVAAARSIGAKVITRDFDFEGLADVVIVK